MALAAGEAVGDAVPCGEAAGEVAVVGVVCALTGMQRAKIAAQTVPTE